ncbi:hypothetical protein V6N13_029514 [Hibiscus sabdariffa]
MFYCSSSSVPPPPKLRPETTKTPSSAASNNTVLAILYLARDNVLCASGFKESTTVNLSRRRHKGLIPDTMRRRDSSPRVPTLFTTENLGSSCCHLSCMEFICKAASFSVLVSFVEKDVHRL